MNLRGRRVLVTGGAGFIGRWLCLALLQHGCRVTVLDNLSNGQLANIAEFQQDLEQFVQADISEPQLLEQCLQSQFDYCFHLAACINVQDSIDRPHDTFQNDVVGTFYLLEAARRTQTPVLFMSTCMVYDRAYDDRGIDETHPVVAASPYAACKLAGEQLTLAYHRTYGLRTTVVRPFNTYGPFQKSSGEGGVVSIFIRKSLLQEPFQIYGNGEQTRDLLYVQDCAEFLLRVAECEAAAGQILNAGLGQDVSINHLAQLVDAQLPVQHVTHIHPQSEIQRLRCCSAKAEQMLEWKARTSLEQGLLQTRQWLQAQCVLPVG